jgi:hypothetical protein
MIIILVSQPLLVMSAWAISTPPPNSNRPSLRSWYMEMQTEAFERVADSPEWIDDFWARWGYTGRFLPAGTSLLVRRMSIVTVMANDKWVSVERSARYASEMESEDDMEELWARLFHAFYRSALHLTRGG